MTLRFGKRRAKEVREVGKNLKLNEPENKRFWESRFLSVVTIILMLAATTGPALAQFTPPTQAAGIPCIGFFCNIATTVAGNALFAPMSSVINGLFSMVNLAVAGLYMVRGYSIVRKIDRNQEEWKQDAFNVGTSLAILFLVYIISLGFISGA